MISASRPAELVRDRLAKDELSSGLHRNLLVILKIEVYSQCTDRQSVSRTRPCLWKIDMDCVHEYAIAEAGQLVK